MKFFRNTLMVFFALTAWVASAQYTVNLTFANGAQRIVDELVVQDGKIILAAENLQIQFEQIKSADFTFDEPPITAAQCLTLLKSADYEKMIAQIDALLQPVKQGLGLRGNLDVYIQYKMRACFWTEKYKEAMNLAEILQNKNSSYAPLAEMYGVLIMLEQNKPVDDARAALDKIDSPENISGAMTEYIQGRMAVLRDNEEALKHFSRVLVYYRRDPEWVPAATYYEAKIYELDGNYDAVSNIKKELNISYSGGYWGNRADDLD